VDKHDLWKKNWPDGVPENFVFPFGEIPIAECVKRHAQETPDKVALYFYGRELTFKEWDESADRLAAALAEMGYKKGDRVLLYTYNCPQWCIAYIASARLGMIIFTADPGFKDMEMEYELTDSDAQLVFAFDLNYPVIERLRKKTAVRDVIVTSFHDYLPENPTLPLHAVMAPSKQSFSGTLEFLELIEKYPPNPPDVPISMDEYELVLYTGGTTGPPKGTLHTHRNTLISACYNYQMSMTGSDLTHVDSSITLTPLGHMGALSLAFFPACVHGIRLVVLARYAAVAVLRAIETCNLDFVMATTPIYQEWIEHPEWRKADLSSVKHWMTYEFMIWLSDDFATRWQDTFGKRVVKYGFGMSEVCNVAVYGGRVGYEVPHKEEFLAGTVAPGIGVDVKITDFDTREELPPGIRGEIAVLSPSRCKGYWKKPKETAEDFSPEGWFYTGDIGMLDDEGYLHWYGRKKYLIRVSGFQVSSGEMEAFGRKCSDIDNIAFVGIPHPVKGEIPKAFVQLVPGSTASAANIEQWFKDNVVSYKVPVVEIVADMPLTPKGSIDMKKLLKQHGK
jgi:acyl-CoA synthetase (AMP-forming)/AMP-acid ligase II